MYTDCVWLPTYLQSVESSQKFSDNDQDHVARRQYHDLVIAAQVIPHTNMSYSAHRGHTRTSGSAAMPEAALSRHSIAGRNGAAQWCNSQNPSRSSAAHCCVAGYVCRAFCRRRVSGHCSATCVPASSPSAPARTTSQAWTP